MKKQYRHSDSYYRILEYINKLKTKKQLVDFLNIHLKWMQSKGWIELTGGVDKRGVLNKRYTLKFHIDSMKDILCSKGIQ